MKTNNSFFFGNTEITTRTSHLTSIQVPTAMGSAIKQQYWDIFKFRQVTQDFPPPPWQGLNSALASEHN